LAGSGSVVIGASGFGTPKVGAGGVGVPEKTGTDGAKAVTRDAIAGLILPTAVTIATTRRCRLSQGIAYASFLKVNQGLALAYPIASGACYDESHGAS
jgi:hypothetical protein